MEVGYFTMPLHPPGSDITKTLDDDLDQIVTLDRLGYKEAWIGAALHGYVGEHLFAQAFYCQSLGRDREHRAGHGRNMYAQP